MNERTKAMKKTPSLVPATLLPAGQSTSAILEGRPA